MKPLDSAHSSSTSEAVAAETILALKEPGTSRGVSGFKSSQQLHHPQEFASAVKSPCVSKKWKQGVDPRVTTARTQATTTTTTTTCSRSAPKTKSLPTRKCAVPQTVAASAKLNVGEKTKHGCRQIGSLKRAADDDEEQQQDTTTPSHSRKRIKTSSAPKPALESANNENQTTPSRKSSSHRQPKQTKDELSIADKIFCSMTKSEMRWEGMYQRLVDFKNKHGHCLVTNRYQSDIALGAWVSTQRRQYKNLLRIDATKRGNKDSKLKPLTKKDSNSTILPEDRMKRLEEIGFAWEVDNPRRIPWKVRFEQLLEFKEKHGHCNVPEGYQENPCLSNWVWTQRKGRQDGRPLTLLKRARFSKLDSVGFVWDMESEELPEGVDAEQRTGANSHSSRPSSVSPNEEEEDMETPSIDRSDDNNDDDDDDNDDDNDNDDNDDDNDDDDDDDDNNDDNSSPFVSSESPESDYGEHNVNVDPNRRSPDGDSDSEDGHSESAPGPDVHTSSASVRDGAADYVPQPRFVDSGAAVGGRHGRESHSFVAPPQESYPSPYTRVPRYPIRTARQLAHEWMGHAGSSVPIAVGVPDIAMALPLGSSPLALHYSMLGVPAGIPFLGSPSVHAALNPAPLVTAAGLPGARHGVGVVAGGMMDYDYADSLMLSGLHPSPYLHGLW